MPRKKAKEYAPGIPIKGRIQPFPSSTSPKIWEASIQLHHAKKAGTHYDLRLGDSSSEFAHSWAIKSLPSPGQKVLAIRQPTHTVAYMDFKGEIPEGYGAGKVEQHFRGNAEILSADSLKIVFNLYQGQQTNKYILISRGGNNWILYNYTTTTKQNAIPTSKASYKEEKIEKINTDDNNQVLAPKVDGAHNVFLLRPNKRIETYSYRPSKKTINRIDHTFKTNLYKTRSPRSIGKTIVRGELYIPGKRSSDVGSVLNSATLLAREKQRTKDTTLQNMIFDVVYYKGKNVESLPYKEKLEILKQINKAVPQLKLPTLAKTPKEKRNLIDMIKNKSHPQTEEGVVIYDLDSHTPKKAKIVKDFDIFIQSIFEGSGKYKGKAAGGFVGSRTPSGDPVVRVGSGLDDATRIDMYKNPKKYVGKWAKVVAQGELSSGKLSMPRYTEIRDYEKWRNK